MESESNSLFALESESIHVFTLESESNYSVVESVLGKKVGLGSAVCFHMIIIIPRPNPVEYYDAVEKHCIAVASLIITPV